MKIVLQRVDKASVIIEGIKETIEKGILVFVAVEKGDTEKDINWLVKKIVNLRIFDNIEGKMDKSVLDINGEILVVSEFTLCGDCSKGNRPDFSSSENFQTANSLYNKFIDEIRKTNLTVKTGKFGSHMFVEILNNGPVTLILSTKDLDKKTFV